MKLRTVFLCACLLILVFGISMKYFTWRDTEFLGEEEVVERVQTFR